MSRSAIIGALFWSLFSAILSGASAQTQDRVDPLISASESAAKAERIIANGKEEYRHDGIAAPQNGGCVAALDDTIIVCAPLEDQTQFRLRSKEEAENDYAKRTMYHNDPQAPNPCFGKTCGIFTGPPTASGLCGFGLNPCPPPPAIMIDLKALPEAPKGSDADRIARGLPPLRNGDDTPATQSGAASTDGPP